MENYTALGWGFVSPRKGHEISNKYLQKIFSFQLKKKKKNNNQKNPILPADYTLHHSMHGFNKCSAGDGEHRGQGNKSGQTPTSEQAHSGMEMFAWPACCLTANRLTGDTEEEHL